MSKAGAVSSHTQRAAFVGTRRGSRSKKLLFFVPRRRLSVDRVNELAIRSQPSTSHVRDGSPKPGGRVLARGWDRWAERRAMLPSNQLRPLQHQGDGRIPTGCSPSRWLARPTSALHRQCGCESIETCNQLPFHRQRPEPCPDSLGVTILMTTFIVSIPRQSRGL